MSSSASASCQLLRFCDIGHALHIMLYIYILTSGGITHRPQTTTANDLPSADPHTGDTGDTGDTGKQVRGWV
jgi:hypothetical protein